MKMNSSGKKGRVGVVGYAAAVIAAAMGIHSHSDTYRPKTRKTGVTYPHSSTRQRARYARQIAAGQIRNA